MEFLEIQHEESDNLLQWFTPLKNVGRVGNNGFATLVACRNVTVWITGGSSANISARRELD